MIRIYVIMRVSHVPTWTCTPTRAYTRTPTHLHVHTDNESREVREEKKGVCGEIEGGWNTHEKKVVCIVFGRRM